MYLDYFLAAASTGLLFEGIRLYRKDQMYRRMVEELDKAKIFDMNYIASIESLPLNKPICLRSRLDVNTEGNTPEELAFTIIDKQRAIDADGTILKQQDAYDTLSSRTSPNTSSSWYLQNDRGEELLLKQQNQVLLHKRMEQLPNTKQHLVKHGEEYTMIGRMKEYDGSLANARNRRHMLEVQMLTNNSKEVFMRLLDNKIMRNATRAKIYLASTALLCTGSILYRRFAQEALKEYRRK